MSALLSRSQGPAPGSPCLELGVIPMSPPKTIAKENRRHKRLMSRATRLDLEDLLEIAAAKKWTAPELEAAAAARAAEVAPAQGAASSGSGPSTATGAASRSEVQPAPDGPREEEAEDERAD